MPIEGNQYGQEADSPVTPQSDAPPTGFLDSLMNMPGFAQWMQRMLEQMGYGVFQPGMTPTGQPDALTTAAKPATIDPFGANWNPNQTTQTPKQPIIVGDWKPPQAKPPEETQASF